MKIRALLFLSVFLLACSPLKAGDHVTIHTSLGTQNISVEIADTPGKREHGLMGRTDLPENHGMLFVWPYELQTSFWMKDTPLSLDMIFVNHDGKIVFITPATIPYSEKLITPDKAFQYTLEVKAGFTKKNGVQVGDEVEIGF